MTEARETYAQWRRRIEQANPDLSLLRIDSFANAGGTQSAKATNLVTGEVWRWDKPDATAIRQGEKPG